MNLIIMRHAEALSVGGLIKSDHDRPLSPRGQAQVFSIATQLKDKNIAVDLIVCSPLTRCTQTAMILGAAFQLPDVSPSPILSPYGVIPDIGPILDLNPDQSLLLVGHHPDVGLLSTSMGAPETPFLPGCAVLFRWDPYERKWRYASTFLPYER